MKDLIEALTIFLKYGNQYAPTHCEHDVLLVAIDPALVTDEDKARLEDLSFHAGDDNSDHDGGFYSFRFGSC